MQVFQRKTAALLAGVALILTAAGGAFAQGSTENRLKALEDRIHAQDEEIRALREQLTARQVTSENLADGLTQYLGKLEEGSWWEEPNASRVTQGAYLKFATADRKFTLQFGGRIMTDYAFFDPDSKTEDEVGSFENAATEFRRARLFVKGTIYGNVFFKAEYDFAGGDADFKDVYVGLKGIPVVGSVKVGYVKVPFGLEELTSSKYITFMERAMPMEAFAPSRKNGIQLGNKAFDGRVQWALMWANDTDGYGNGPVANNYGIRITGQPILEDQGKEMLLHLGVAYLLRKPQDDALRFRTRPEAHLATHRVADTSGIPGVESAHQFGFEAAFLLGSFSAQAEYILVQIDSDEADDPRLSGYYVSVSYLLTGEVRPFKGSTFSRVKPLKNFDGEGGGGAFEIAARYSSVDLDDGDLSDSALPGADNFTFGVNWYLNPNARVMANYVLSDVDGADGLSIFQIRFQVDF